MLQADDICVSRGGFGPLNSFKQSDKLVVYTIMQTGIRRLFFAIRTNPSNLGQSERTDENPDGKI